MKNKSAHFQTQLLCWYILYRLTGLGFVSNRPLGLWITPVRDASGGQGFELYFHLVQNCIYTNIHISPQHARLKISILRVEQIAFTVVLKPSILIFLLSPRQIKKGIMGNTWKFSIWRATSKHTLTDTATVHCMLCWQWINRPHLRAARQAEEPKAVKSNRC